MYSKVCLQCETEFQKPKRLGKFNWDNRKFCTRKCCIKYQHVHLNNGIFTSKRLEGNKFRQGKRPWNYIGVPRTENDLMRRSTKYKEWRKAVFERDNYNCQACGQRGRNLQADHIKPFSTHPELRFELSNGRTLCKPCHLKTDTWGGRSWKIWSMQSANA